MDLTTLIAVFEGICILYLFISNDYYGRKYADKGRKVKTKFIEVGETVSTGTKEKVEDDTYGLEINHVSISVYNLDRAKDFYISRLKLKKIDRPKEFDKHFRGEWFEFPSGQQLHLVLNPNANFPTNSLIFEGNIPPPAHFAIKMKSYDLRRLVTELKLKGEKVEQKEYKNNIAQYYLKDRDGYIIELTDVKNSKSIFED